MPSRYGSDRGSSPVTLAMRSICVACSAAALASVGASAAAGSRAGITFVPVPRAYLAQCRVTARRLGYPIPCPTRLPKAMTQHQDGAAPYCSVTIVCSIESGPWKGGRRDRLRRPTSTSSSPPHRDRLPTMRKPSTGPAGRRPPTFDRSHGSPPAGGACEPSSSPRKRTRAPSSTTSRCSGRSAATRMRPVSTTSPAWPRRSASTDGSPRRSRSSPPDSGERHAGGR
jgi:hypothetical protein